MEIMVVMILIGAIALVAGRSYRRYKEAWQEEAVAADLVLFQSAARCYGSRLASNSNLPHELSLFAFQQACPSEPWGRLHRLLGTDYTFRWITEPLMQFEIELRAEGLRAPSAQRDHQRFQAAGKGAVYRWRCPLEQYHEQLDPPLTPLLLNLQNFRQYFDVSARRGANATA